MKSGGAEGVITIIYDNNRAEDPALRADWGFACVVDAGGKRVLFDTGADGDILLHNMAHLHIDPATIDIVVLSHWHADHVGGLKKFLALRKHVPVYLPASFSRDLVDTVRMGGGTVMEVLGPAKIADGFETTGEMGVLIREQALIVKTPEGPVVVTGCAHPDIIKVVERAASIGGGAPLLVVGGYHLKDAPDERIEEVIRAFRRMGVKQVAPCHCTGERARSSFVRAYGTNALHAGLGTVLRFSAEETRR